MLGEVQPEWLRLVFLVLNPVHAQSRRSGVIIPILQMGNGWRSHQTDLGLSPGPAESSLLPRADGGSRKCTHLG